MRLAYPIDPMLARTAPAPFDSPQHLFEVKWDGFRCLAYTGGALDTPGPLRLQSRNQRDITARYPGVASIWRQVRGAAVIDGELVAFKDGRPDFQCLLRGNTPPVFLAFDLLWAEGVNFTGHPLEKRRERLASLIEPGGPLILSEVVPEKGRSFFRAVAERGLEGIMAKELGSPYRPGQRSQYWLKVRNVRRLNAVIGGVSSRDGIHISSLHLGLYQGPDLVWVGRVGSGLGQREDAALRQILAYQERSPFVNPVSRDEKTVIWVRPERVCRVEYLEFTRDRVLRHPVFRGIVGLDPEACTYSQIPVEDDR
ncbi:MAG: ATP-dependent DNA ligase [Bacillota bacterium]